MIIVWFVVAIVLGVLVAVLTRGAPRVLAVVALVLVIGNSAFSWWGLPLLFEAAGNAALTGLVSGILGAVNSVLVLGLFIAAAAIASRAKPAVTAAQGGLR